MEVESSSSSLTSLLVLTIVERRKEFVSAAELLKKAFVSSTAEMLHDLPRNSIVSVGVSGGNAVFTSRATIAGPSSSMFSSFFHELSFPVWHIITEQSHTTTINLND